MTQKNKNVTVHPNKDRSGPCSPPKDYSKIDKSSDECILWKMPFHLLLVLGWIGVGFFFLLMMRFDKLIAMFN
jgi:hypothetical protein